MNVWPGAHLLLIPGNVNRRPVVNVYSGAHLSPASNRWRLHQWMHKKVEARVKIRTGERMCEKISEWMNEWMMCEWSWSSGHHRLQWTQGASPGWPTQPGLTCVVLVAICFRIFLRIAIFHPIVSSLDCMIVTICPQMIRKIFSGLKKSFSNCEPPNEYQCSSA